MAEFQEVMRQWKRMCGANSYCNTCRMQKENLPYTLCSEGGIRSVENIADAELTIMAWAKEHPEPKYPTWYEYLTGLYKNGWDAIHREHIPDNIAEKLGLEPKED